MRFVLIMPMALVTLSANAQSTAFTYQGEIKNGAQLASGLHDFHCRLFNAQTNGVQIGSTICVNNVTVTDGNFAITIDFGQQFISPDPRFLELEARRDTGLDCSNATGFTVTGPRQQIADTPIALHANSTSTLLASNGTSAVSASNDGNIGIGTTSPSADLHIRRPAPSLILQDMDGTFPGSYVSYLNNSGAETGWFGFGHSNSPIMSVANGRASGHIALLPGSNGNVGFGTGSPIAKLDVRGDIRMGSSGQHFALRGNETLRVLRGEVNSAGTRIRGAGFTSSRIDVGKYRISFATPFAAVPSVLTTAWRGDQAVTANSDSADTSSAVIVTYSTLVDNYADASFEFIIIGPR